MLPQFFKVIRFPEVDRLFLPARFGRLFINSHIPCGTIRLRSAGVQTWEVVLQADGDKYVFTGGWIEIVRSKGLGLRDVVVFKAVLKDVFEITCFKNGFSGYAFFRMLLDRKPYFVVNEEFIAQFFRKARSGRLVEVSENEGGTWKLKVDTRLKRLTLGGPGYEKMKEDLSLEFGHFLVFKISGSYKLQVIVFHCSGVQVVYSDDDNNVIVDEVVMISDEDEPQEVPYDEEPVDDSDEVVMLSEEDDQQSVPSNEQPTDTSDVIHFIKRAEKGRLRIPKRISTVADLDSDLRPFEVRYLNCRQFTMGVRKESDRKRARYALTSLLHFVAENNVSPGDLLTFSYNNSARLTTKFKLTL